MMITKAEKKEIRELQAKKRTRTESGLYVVDGPRMCGELAPEEVLRVFVTDKYLASPVSAMTKELLNRTEVCVITGEEMESISDTMTPQGILALVRQKRTLSPEEFTASLPENPVMVFLEDVQDPGNVGTIFRACEAAGITAVVMSPGCADIYAPKTVRSTMGAIFRLPFIIADPGRILSCLRSRVFSAGPFRAYAACPENAENLYGTDFTGPSAFMIGNEAAGLSAGLIRSADGAVRIPMKGKTESLNAAMAATVIAFEVQRQRSFS